MKITILGGAGVRIPLIVQALSRCQERIGLTELALMDIDAERLAIIGDLTAPLEASDEVHFSISRTTDARQALSGADYVITTFRVGNMQGRVIDERVALKYGVLGQETTGPGGFAMAMRTIPVLLGYLGIMREVCPQAWLLNFANPAGIMAETILRVGGWKRAVGICDSPGTVQRVAAAILGVSPDQVYLDYFGLNHLGWVRSIIYQEKDYLPEFIEQIARQGGFPDLPFPSELVSSLGMIPNEYLYYYYFSKQAVHNLQKAEQTRGEQILELNDALFADLKRLKSDGQGEAMLKRYQAYLNRRGETYMATETGRRPGEHAPEPEVARAVEEGGYAGVAINLIEALSGRGPRPMILNIQNRGAVLGMAPDDVVEINGYAGPGFIRPMAVGDVPDACLGLMKQVKAYERLTIAAAVEGSYAKALEALTIHPLVSDGTLARAILDEYRQQHGPTFPALG